MDVDAVEIVPRLLGRDGEAGAVDQRLEVAAGDRELVRQRAAARRREIVLRQGLQRKARPAGAQHDLAAVAAALDQHLSAFGQLAHDVVQRVGGRGGGAGLRHRRRDALDDGQVHVGGGEAEAAVAGLEQDVGEDRNGVAAFHHTLHMGERFEQGAAFDGEFHGVTEKSEKLRSSAAPGPKGKTHDRLPRHRPKGPPGDLIRAVAHYTRSGRKSNKIAAAKGFARLGLTY